MFSSVIFAALAVAWLVILVPMFARRRQEVSRTTDSALAARVVRRGNARRPAAGADPADRTSSNDTRDASTPREETFSMPDTDRYGAGRDDVGEYSEFADELEEQAEYSESDEYDDDQRRAVYSDDVRAGRRYRPGRGGYDPEAAAMAARVKYARRQRVVLFMLVGALATGLVAGFVWPVLWWAHAAFDLSLIGYLTYLRRQVRIEEDIRNRRLARMSREDDDDVEEYDDSPADEYAADYAAEDPVRDYPDVDFEDVSPRAATRRPRSAEADSLARDAEILELDDEDPLFDELDERYWEPYRRASGE